MVTFFFVKKSLTEPTGVLEHCREEKPIVGFPFFWAFPSDRIFKTTKGVDEHFFIHISAEISLNQPSL